MTACCLPENFYFGNRILNMISEQQIKFYRQQLRQGLPDGELKERLKQEGFTTEDIDAVFEPHHYDMRAWYLTFGIIITLLGLYLFLQTGGILIMGLGILLFVAYSFEIRRLERLKKADKPKDN
jgi:hypothetical protein